METLHDNTTQEISTEARKADPDHSELLARIANCIATEPKYVANFKSVLFYINRREANYARSLVCDRSQFPWPDMRNPVAKAARDAAEKKVN